MRVVLLGFTVPDRALEAILQSDAHMPTQTHTFAWALVESLRAGSAQVSLISTEPVSSFPHNRRVIFRRTQFVEHGVHGETLGFINVVLVKHLTRLASCLTRGLGLLRRWKPDALLIHGVHSPFLLFSAIARRLLRVKTVVVLTDPPGVHTPHDGVVVRLLKTLDKAVVRRLLQAQDGVVALTDALAADYAPGKPRLVMEGIFKAPTSTLPYPREGMPSDGLHIVYAGGLGRGSGVDHLVTAFRRAAPLGARLIVLGRGDLREWIDTQADLDPRIEKVQLLSREEVLATYRTADLLVQPRSTDASFVPYSFPSKLLEYLASGTPVLSTRLAGIPSEYDPFLYWIDEESIEGFERALVDVLARPVAERRATGTAAARFVADNRTTEAQGRRVVRFLASLKGN